MSSESISELNTGKSSLLVSDFNSWKQDETNKQLKNNEIQFIGTEGKLEVSRGYLKTYPDKSLAKKPIDKVNYERVYLSNNHHKDWLKAIRKRRLPICDVEIGHRTASVCNIVNIAYALQRPLNWNPNSEKFINDPGANLMLDRTYRGKWSYINF